ncbi:hypothetical protein [Lysobacter arvi]|uniref:Uncharacterized protein n=1 Tax=Lysobacter arvi TaxID=3038776 RepID=A0ABU1C947_9GAMM|nr:hypothetical protein [Lysobacter arvi]MDR0181714.1 hypothetical protein [Lysobacter arvi]
MSTYRPHGANGYTTSPFGKPSPDKAVTHERIAADMAAFSKAGGQVEILGVTPLRRKPEKSVVASGLASAKKPASTK